MGLGMKRRDLQRAMGVEKSPWEIGKSFDQPSPIRPFHLVQEIRHFTKGAIILEVNDAVKQRADLSFMIWSVDEEIVKQSEAIELFPGDIIYSDTHQNVGPVVRGDIILSKTEKLPEMSIQIVRGRLFLRMELPHIVKKLFWRGG